VHLNAEVRLERGLLDGLYTLFILMPILAKVKIGPSRVADVDHDSWDGRSYGGLELSVRVRLLPVSLIYNSFEVLS